MAIARAPVGVPKFVLPDEPPGTRDPDNAPRVLSLLAEQVRQRGAAATLATHPTEVARACDRRYRLTASGLVDAA